MKILWRLALTIYALIYALLNVAGFIFLTIFMVVAIFTLGIFCGAYWIMTGQTPDPYWTPQWSYFDTLDGWWNYISLQGQDKEQK